MPFPEKYSTTFPTAYTPPLGTGILKQSPEDFIVNEVLSFPFSGEGEHAYLQIQKTGENTMWVVRLLAKHFNTRERDIGYAGLKDRQAITTQWFSLPAKNITDERLAAFNEPTINILTVNRHSGKLRKGAIRYNEFKITLREVELDEAELIERLQRIEEQGVPNYFDEQRFGKSRNNLVEADNIFQGTSKPKKHKRRLYISAARSWLFNQVLARRVKIGNWYTAVPGDLFILDGSKKYFHAETIDDELRQRLIEKDIHPSGPLPGDAIPEVSNDALTLEQGVLSDWMQWCEELKKARLPTQRRATRVVPSELKSHYDSDQQMLTLEFALPAGAYATNLLREVISINY